MKRIVLLVIIMATCMVTAVADAATAEQRCKVVKLRALAAELNGILLCTARALPAGADLACRAAAAARRDRAFRRAEERGGCTTVGDSEVAGSLVAALPWDLVNEQNLDGPARCVRRTLFVAGRAATRVAAIFAHGELVQNEARLTAQLARARSYAERAYDRVRASAGCQSAYPTDQFYSDIERRVSRLRDAVCPSCGLFCPCWTTAQLDEWFPPGSFAAKGAIACQLDALGYVVGVSASFCRVPRFGGGGWPRSGFQIAPEVGLCVLVPGDIDRDDDGVCGGSGDVFTNVNPEQAKVCIADVLATQVAQQDCVTPH